MQTLSISEFIQKAAAQLEASDAYYGHGTDNADDEARWLVLGSLKINWDCDDALLQRELSGDELRFLEKQLHTRVETKQPTAYLLGEAWFAGKAYIVTPDVLVPRSPFAQLVHARFEHWLEGKDPARVLDLCTGSGCIGIASAFAFPNAKVDLGDISKQAIAVSKQNIERHKLGGRVNAIESDLFAGLEGRYDLIISNPPYVPRYEYEALPFEYLQEPKLGLEAGEDGLSLVIPMLEQAADYLEDGGWLFVEVGDTENFLAECFPEVPFQWIEFSNGGSGVFALSKQELIDSRASFAAIEL